MGRSGTQGYYQFELTVAHEAVRIGPYDSPDDYYGPGQWQQLLVVSGDGGGRAVHCCGVCVQAHSATKLAAAGLTTQLRRLLREQP